MSALALRWRRPDPPIVVRWRGPDGAMLDAVAAAPEAPIAAVIGPPGAPGSAGGVATRIAGEAIGGHRAVAIGNDGKAYTVSPGDLFADAVFGVTSGAAAAGASVSIVSTGELREAAWSWGAGPVWLGDGGVLTQVLPTSGALVRVGTAGGPDAINVEPRLIARL